MDIPVTITEIINNLARSSLPSISRVGASMVASINRLVSTGATAYGVYQIVNKLYNFLSSPASSGHQTRESDLATVTEFRKKLPKFAPSITGGGASSSQDTIEKAYIDRAEELIAIRAATKRYDVRSGRSVAVARSYSPSVMLPNTSSTR